jgi:XTP/dITP diphosphohydrolase
MRGATGEERRARFVTVIGVSYDGGDHLLEGAVAGYIAEQNRGENGFGYDPVFIYPSTGKTFAEMTAAEKNQVSHRARALTRFKEWLIAG